MLKVPLTPAEDAALKISGNAADEELEGMYYLQLVAQGAGSETAKATSAELAKLAQSARRKIREATAYEIVVMGEDKTNKVKEGL